MHILILFAVIVVVLFIFAAGMAATALENKIGAINLDREYKERAFLLTPTELRFFHVLKNVVSTNETLFIKIRQADILDVQCAKQHPRFWERFNRISQRHVDFVLCDSQTTKPLTIIELNDQTHNRPDRMKRDAELRSALKRTSIKLIEIPVQATYDVNKLKALIYPYSYPGGIAATPIPPTEIRNKSFSPPSPRPEVDKYTPAGTDTAPPPKKPGQKAATTPRKPYPSHLIFPHPDSRYMPKG